MNGDVIGINTAILEEMVQLVLVFQFHQTVQKL